MMPTCAPLSSTVCNLLCSSGTSVTRTSGGHPSPGSPVDPLWWPSWSMRFSVSSSSASRASSRLATTSIEAGRRPGSMSSPSTVGSDSMGTRARADVLTDVAPDGGARSAASSSARTAAGAPSPTRPSPRTAARVSAISCAPPRLVFEASDSSTTTADCAAPSSSVLVRVGCFEVVQPQPPHHGAGWEGDAVAAARAVPATRPSPDRDQRRAESAARPRRQPRSSQDTQRSRCRTRAAQALRGRRGPPLARAADGQVRGSEARVIGVSPTEGRSAGTGEGAEVAAGGVGSVVGSAGARRCGQAQFLTGVDQAGP